MPKYDKLKSTPQPLYNSDHFYSWDQAMQQLAVVNYHLQKCEACNMQVGAQREECDALCEFFTGLNEKYRGPQSESPEVLKS